MLQLNVIVLGKKNNFSSYLKKLNEVFDTIKISEHISTENIDTGDAPLPHLIFFEEQESMVMDFIYAQESDSNRKNTPVILATTITDEIFIKSALSTGIIDLIQLPLNPSIFVLKLSKLLQIKSNKTAAHNKHFGIIPILNKDNLSVTYKGKTNALTLKEFRLLELLTNRVNSVVTREEITKLVWPGKKEEDSRIIDTYIRKLRSKLGQRIITTIIGKGYIIKA